MTIRCEICGKEFKTTQGLRGHKTFVHGITKNGSGPATDREGVGPTSKSADTGKGKRPTVPSRKQNQPGDSSVSTEEDVPRSKEKVHRYTELTQKTAGEVKLLREDHKKIDTKVGKLDTTVEKLEEVVSSVQSILNDARNKYTELINNALPRMKGEIDKFAGQLAQQSQTIEHLKDDSQANNVLNKKYVDLLNSVNEKLSIVESEISIVRNLAIRQPTGELISDSLFGQGDRKYKAYRGPDGLTEPYRCSQDPISGDRWIDLAQPED